MNESVRGKYELWRFEALYSFNENTQLVINKSTKRLMIKKTLPESQFAVHSALMSLDNKHIAKVYDTVKADRSCTVLEEYISGETLEQLCEGKPLSEDRVRDIIIQLCIGLEEIHEKGLIHRDLTPTNILISSDGVIKIIDFGISRFEKAAAPRDTTLLGTEGFAAPEQFGFSQSTPQTDIYALGVLMSFMLTGALPIKKRYSGPLSGVIARCTEIDSKKRYESVGELKKALGMKNKKSYSYSEKITDYIPGLRSKSKAKRVWSVIGYIFIGLFMYTAYRLKCRNVTDFLKITAMFLTMFFIPIMIFSDFLDFKERIPFLKKINRLLLNIILGVIAVACIIIGHNIFLVL